MRRLWFGLWYWLPRRPPWDTGVTPPELERFMGSHPPGRALDLGCGTGTNVVYLTRHGWTAGGTRRAGSIHVPGRRRDPARGRGTIRSRARYRLPAFDPRRRSRRLREG